MYGESWRFLQVGRAVHYMMDDTDHSKEGCDKSADGALVLAGVVVGEILGRPTGFGPTNWTVRYDALAGSPTPRAYGQNLDEVVKEYLDRLDQWWMSGAPGRREPKFVEWKPLPFAR